MSNVAVVPIIPILIKGVPVAMEQVHKELGIEQNEYQDAASVAAREYLDSCGLVPNDDAIEQLTHVFLPCLMMICQRGYDPTGGTWKKSGRLGVLADLRKKFERSWHFLWLRREDDHADSLLDLINYAGFVLRAPKDGFGDWGEPGCLKPQKMEWPAEGEKML